MRRRAILLMSVLAVALISARSASAETIRVFAAAPTTEASKEIGANHQKKHRGDRVEFNFAGGQALRTQIEPGVFADTFASVDLMQTNALASQGKLHPHQVNVVNRETNVRAALSEVVLGEADAGFVDLTDATTMKGKMNQILLPNAVNVTAVYPIAVTPSSKALLQTTLFNAEVRGKRGQAILRKYGFQP